MHKMGQAMTSIIRLAGAGFLLSVFSLAGCAVTEQKSRLTVFPIPPRPEIWSSMPIRPFLSPGDVLAGLIEGEAGPRVCFRPGKWKEILSFLVELEAYGRSGPVELNEHIEKLENQVRKMNRALNGGH